MSAKSIALYAAHQRREAPTLPPPADLAAREKADKVRKLRGLGFKLLSRAAALEAELEEEREVVECGSIDSDDPRHPNHPLNCVKPCCAWKGEP